MINKTELWGNLDEVRTTSLVILARFTAAFGFVWFMLVLYPATGTLRSPLPWISSLLLIAGSVICDWGKNRNSQLCRVTFVIVLWAALAMALIVYQPADLTVLMILPVLFSSVLLSRRVMILIACASCIFILQLHTGTTEAFQRQGLILPGTILIAAGAAWLSVSNLYTTLFWFYDAYTISSQNERIARERQGELRRIAKALDEATFSMSRLNYALTLERNRADEARRLKQQFVQNISHELRTPLNLIVGFSELMLQSPGYYGQSLPTSYMRDMSIVHRNALHLQKLVNDVLDLSRIEAAQLSIIPEWIDPADLVMDALETIHSLVESRGLRLSAEIESTLPDILVDPTRLRQVLFNLLNNAARFTDSGGITVTARREGDEVVFAVRDTGIGIAEHELPRIFDEFHQVDGSTRRKYEGAGLGLTISRQFVQLHGGRIWVNSTIGVGSTFSFSLPINVASQSQPARPIDALMSTDPPSDTSLTDKKRLLITVTRSPMAASLVTRYAQGYRTLVVSDIAQAGVIAHEQQPQGILVDLSEQPLNTADLEVLAHDWELPHVPFIGCVLPGEELMRRQLTVNGYITKPILRQELWDVLRPFGDRIDRILAVDDDHDFLQLITRMLDNPQRRYDVFNAYTPAEALAMLKLHRPDLILLDLELPGTLPGEMLSQIRQDAHSASIPIIIITGRDSLPEVDFTSRSMVIHKTDGILPTQMMHWLQAILDSTSLTSIR